MKLTILKIFDAEAGHLKIDSRLIKDITRYVASFVNKNDDTLQFLGSPLVGVYPFRYAKTDENEWFDDVLEMDDLTLQSNIREHFGDSDNNLSATWKISSNVTNLSFVWLAHRIRNSNLKDREKTEGEMACMKMLQYKLISSLDSHFFRYPANSEVASAVYASLSKKYLLKKYGSWAKVIEARSEDLLGDDSIHKRAIDKMDDDEDIVYLINDTQGRHKDIYKRVTTLFYEFRESDSRIQSISATIELSGEMGVRDKQNNYGKYRAAAHDIASTPSSLLREKALGVITSIVHTAPPQAVKESLEWLASNYGAPRTGYIKEFVELNITHACEYIRKNELPLSDLATILVRLRGIHLASRQSDKTVLEIRELGTKITDQSVQSKNQAVHASVRAAIILYLVLRTLAKDNL
tara:strand:- start:116 stop:1339 length:1224 start_codon:yes stop_codon:yes gene_type:complete